MLKMLNSKPAQALGTGFGILTGVGTLLSWFTPAWFGQLTFSEAIIVGIGFALAASLAIAITLAIFAWGYRRLRPLPADDAPPELNHPSAIGLGPFEQRVADIEERQKAIIHDYQTVLAKLGNHDDAIGQLATDLRRLTEQTEAHRSLDADANAERFKSLYVSLTAIYHRERLRFLGQTIETGATELAAPTNDSSLIYDEDRWEEWETNEKAWRGILQRWCELASVYVPNIASKVMATDTDHFKQKGQATINQFPTPEAYIGYKEFCALWKNFRENQEAAAKAVHAAAFDAAMSSNRPRTLGDLYNETMYNQGPG